ncbi:MULTISPECIES: DUF6907 domain-containing protein [Streptomyces]|uniref:Uncharacterized protein n=1 Tax=Streptomyces dengpaensis TaxID=2049881 RepID=A0ABN5I444_9ACTN|nr:MULTISPECIES: hypothetical protein [Streptomyces]AVH57795.1 hypothetical protein C4B68_20735 [Streptomyces dengpaensis]PIA98566.1 hypothetical protein B1C81_39465 [Streptomyces sp. HG99]
MTAPRTVTLATVDRGNVTIPEPAWCSGHSHHDPLTEYADIIHSSPEHTLNFRYVVLLAAGLVQSPHATTASPGLGGPTPGVSVHPLGETLDPTGLYSLAAALDAYSDQLRTLADQLDAILDGGGQ